MKKHAFSEQEVQFAVLSWIALDSILVSQVTHSRLWKEHVQTKYKHLIGWTLCQNWQSPQDGLNIERQKYTSFIYFNQNSN